VRSEQVVALNLFLIKTLSLKEEFFPPLLPHKWVQNLNAIFDAGTFREVLIHCQVLKRLNLMVKLVQLIFRHHRLDLILKLKSTLGLFRIWLLVVEFLLLNNLGANDLVLFFKVFHDFECSPHVCIDLMVLKVSLQPLLLKLIESIKLLLKFTSLIFK